MTSGKAALRLILFVLTKSKKIGAFKEVKMEQNVHVLCIFAVIGALLAFESQNYPSKMHIQKKLF